MFELRGCGTALVTPFKADGSIDERAFRSLVQWQIESGIDFPRSLRHHGRNADSVS